MVALVQRPAPDFKATAVIKGKYKDISLSDYTGQWYGMLSMNIFFGPNGRVYPQACHFILSSVSCRKSVYPLWLYMCFYFRDFTPTGHQDIIAFNDALPLFKEIQTTVLGMVFRVMQHLSTLFLHFPVAVSTDSHYSHLAWSTQPRGQDGLGPDLMLPLVADKTMRISRKYGVLFEEEGTSLRCVCIIDPKGIVR